MIDQEWDNRELVRAFFLRGPKSPSYYCPSTTREVLHFNFTLHHIISL